MRPTLFQALVRKEPVLRTGSRQLRFQREQNFALFGERTRLGFRADFFNLFNHTNFANPTGNQSSSSFGKITQTVGSAVATSVGTTAGPLGGPRLIQLAMRLQF